MVRVIDRPDGMVRFEGETMIVSHKGRSVEVHDLCGWRDPIDGEVEFDPESAARYAEAGDRLVLAARREEGLMLRRVRKKLGLSQEEAAKLTGGGHNAFSRYESGKTQPMPAVVNLFTLLDRHPALLDELRR
ncbi:type II toxin-antitoxin system MqsA family antitoxin [Roseicella aquatilis]|uniref:Type II toxin-antitoxin system MqsA family antitoxin n=1 Tax=Roseicella aquatilis TaxID=2527868 RepID=A0A4R4D3L7_9PROT|nr:type II toxin-antitoxin system MqsA family antitoxin [Roseicella aquatilis]TCZ51107.1 type II toxin-antitoxin system MqsA family antitoxin [Roseicella aquatilis]